MGEVHRLVTDTGVYAVKRAFWREDPDGVVEQRARLEVGFVERCRAAGLRSPRPIVAADGVVIARDGAGTGWRVHEFAGGVVPERSDLAAQRWVLEQGARIHRLAIEPAPGDTLPEWYTRAAVDWADLAAEASAAGAEWAPRLRARATEFAELGAWAGAVPVGPLVQCHRDLKATNTLVEANGIRWLLDWDDVGAHDPVRETGTVLLHHVPDEAALMTLAATYGRAGGAALPEGADLFASGVTVWLNFLSGQARVLLDPTSEAQHRQFATGPVLGLLRDVPSLAVLARCGRVAAQAANREREAAARTMGA